MTLQKVKGNLEHMFTKNLTDIVRGIRGNKDNEGKYIAQCLEEIKIELNQENVTVKTNAIRKLIYLQMLGYEMSWATFNTIELMSCPKFANKRIGYFAASQSFHANTELLMLTTNTIRKDLNSSNQYEAGVALSALSCFINNGLARDLSTDVITLLNSTKPYVRKKALLILYNVFLKFPEMLRLAFPRIKEKLEDEDPYVQAAAMNVICELAAKNPKIYLSVSPVLFKLLSVSTNNWLLIKIIKLFGVLAPLEPRLGRKLADCLTSLIHSTCAMSVLYECINTLIAILPTLSPTMLTYNASIQLCIQKLIILIEDSDQNLKYLGLTSMSKIMKHHSKFIHEHKDLVIQCLDDKDESICRRALDLLQGMVTKKNLPEIVQKLVTRMDKTDGKLYRDQLLHKILDLCRYNNYYYVVNFEWHIEVLVHLSRVNGSHHGSLVASQMLDIAVRVSSIRTVIVQQMSQLLCVTGFIMVQVLSAASWICGEFCEQLSDPESTLKTMCNGRIFFVPGHIQAVYIHNILKLLSNVVTNAMQTDDREKVDNSFKTALATLTQLTSSCYLEVQERASSSCQIIVFIKKQLRKGNLDVLQDMTTLFAGDLNPVAPKAQQKVMVPSGLDLDQWINEPIPDHSGNKQCLDSSLDILFVSDWKDKKEPTNEELEKQRSARIIEQAKNPHYLKSSKKIQKDDMVNVSNIPINEIDLSIPLKIPGIASPSRYFTLGKKLDGLQKHKLKKSKKTTKHTVSLADSSESATVHVNTDIGEMPCEDDSKDPGDIDLSVARLLPIDPTETRLTKNKKKKKKWGYKKRRSCKDVPPEGDLLGNNLDMWLKYGSSGYQSVLMSTNGEDIIASPSGDMPGPQVVNYNDMNLISLNPDNEEVIKSSTIIRAEISDMNDTSLGETTTYDTNETNLEEYTSYLCLAEDKTICMMFERSVLPDKNAVTATMLFVNKGPLVVKELDLFVSEQDALMMLREEHDLGECSVKMAFVLLAHGSHTAKLNFQVRDSSRPQKLRGTITYMVETRDGISTHDKLDFWLPFPCSSFLTTTMVPLPAAVDPLAEQYTCYSLLDGDLHQVTSQLCARWHFQLLEFGETVATMQSASLDGHRVHLQISENEGQISMVFKSTSQLLVINLLAEE